MEALWTPAEVQAILHITAHSLARHCGIETDPSEPDSRPEERRLVALKQQLGSLQTWEKHEAHAIYCEFSAKYLPALVAKYKTFSTPTNTAMKMMNVVAHLPYFARFQRTPAGSDLVVLQATRMAGAVEDDNLDSESIAERCQFLSTLFVLQGTSAIPEDVKGKLISKLGTWRRRYQGLFPGETSDRCYQILKGTSEMAFMSRTMKEMLEKPLNQCGARECGHRVNSVGPELRQCSRCKCAVYCGAAHQKQHWAEHKTSCYPCTF